MTSLTIQHHEFGVPAHVSIDTSRREGILLSTRIEVTSMPSSEISFWLDSDLNHHGLANHTLTGAVSPQGRQRELLSQSIVDNLYKHYITIQKQAAHAPSYSLMTCLGEIWHPDEEMKELLNNSPSASHSYADEMLKKCFKGLVVLVTISEKFKISEDNAPEESLALIWQKTASKIREALSHISSSGESTALRMSLFLENLSMEIGSKKE